MDQAEIDAAGKGLQFFGDTVVDKCEIVKGQPNVYLLQTTIHLERESQSEPKAGQFYLIRAKKTGVNYNRPISVYHSETVHNTNGTKDVSVQFMILKKGRGTNELCELKTDDLMTVIGPLGTSWPKAEGKALIIGAGIGVAPVANFASTLPDNSYDFYASFKSGAYGLEHVHAENLVITTDDGSVGIKGILPVALTKEAVEKAGYKVIYACGPTPALVYVKKLAEELGIQCWISMEHRMLCGLGACLGCTIETTEGLRRCCKDGPVFDAKIIKFEEPAPRRLPLPPAAEPDLSVTIAGVNFKNPVIASGGTFSFGQNFRGVSDVTAWGRNLFKGHYA